MVGTPGLYASYPPDLDSDGYPLSPWRNAPVVQLNDYSIALRSPDSAGDHAIYWRFIPYQSGLVRFDVSLSFEASDPYHTGGAFTFNVYGENNGIWGIGPAGYGKDMSIEVIEDEPILIEIPLWYAFASVIILRVSDYAGTSLVSPRHSETRTMCATDQQIAVDDLLVGLGSLNPITNYWLGATIDNSFASEPSSDVMKDQTKILWLNNYSAHDDDEYHPSRCNSYGSINGVVDGTSSDYGAPFSSTGLAVGPPPFIPSEGLGADGNNFSKRLFWTSFAWPTELVGYTEIGDDPYFNGLTWSSLSPGARMFAWNLVAIKETPVTTYSLEKATDILIDATMPETWDFYIGEPEIQNAWVTYDHEPPEAGENWYATSPDLLDAPGGSPLPSVRVPPDWIMEDDGVIHFFAGVNDGSPAFPASDLTYGGVDIGVNSIGSAPEWIEVPSSLIATAQEVSSVDGGESDSLRIVVVPEEMIPGDESGESYAKTGGEQWNAALRLQVLVPEYRTFDTYLPELPEFEVGSITGAFELERARFS